MDKYRFDKTFTFFFATLLGITTVAIIIMFGWMIYDTAPMSLYIIAGLLVLWALCYLGAWWHDMRVKRRSDEL